MVGFMGAFDQLWPIFDLFSRVFVVQIFFTQFFISLVQHLISRRLLINPLIGPGNLWPCWIKPNMENLRRRRLPQSFRRSQSRGFSMWPTPLTYATEPPRKNESCTHLFFCFTLYFRFFLESVPYWILRLLYEEISGSHLFRGRRIFSSGFFLGGPVA